MKFRLITLAIVLVLIAAPLDMTVFADVVGSHNTNVDISFASGNGVVPPVDPDDPGVETGEPGTNQPGPLSLDWVPTLRFGSSHAISNTVKSYDTVTSRPYIQVTDLRGTGSGWKVTAALSGFTSDQGASLQGAYITMKNGGTNTATTGITAPVPANPVTLSSDNTPANIATASDTLQAGRGTWVIRWYPANGAADVQLTVPAAAAVVGSHTATITWTLHDAP